MFFTTGGFPFGDAETSHRARRDVDTNKYYEVLGVPKDCSVAEIKKAYRKLAIKNHPDKGGDPEVFKEISRAYEILADPEKRKLYDVYGEDGLEGQSASDPTDIFDLFFGGGKSRGPSGKRRGEDIETNLKVTLEQIYNGATRKMAISKDVICEKCDGDGGPKEAIENCSLCGGTGIRVQFRRFGPMTQQTQSPCTSCRQGKVIPPNKQCQRCDGTGTCKEKKVLEVYIEKGVPSDHRVVFSGEADHRPNTIPGDVRFIISEQEHPIFTRKSCNLIMKKEITLFEALTGYKFIINHLDSRQLLVEGCPNEVVKPGTLKVIRNEGMPVYKNPMEKGHLIIEFLVKFPLYHELSRKNNALYEALQKILPTPTPLKNSDNIPENDHYTPEDLTAEDLQNKHAHRSEVYDDDDAEEGHPRVQCRQQ